LRAISFLYVQENNIMIHFSCIFVLAFILSLNTYNCALAQLPLGQGINSIGNEINPRISPEGLKLYFVRSHSPLNIGGVSGGQDIWMSQRKAIDQPWQPPIRLPINSASQDALFSITPDGESVLMVSQTPRALILVQGSADWRQSRVIDTLFLPEFKSKSGYVSYFLANDGQTLILEYQGDEGFGAQDLYVSFRQSSGEWSQPLNLGPTINTIQFEFSPFLAADGFTLYFSSNGHKGEGNADIFMTRRLDDSWTAWTKPVNIGAPMNTPEFDAYFSVTASGDSAYYSSKSGKNNIDLYVSALAPQFRPKPSVMVSGLATDQQKDAPVPALIRYYRLRDGQNLGAIRADSATGRFRLTLATGERYALVAEHPSYYPLMDTLDLTQMPKGSEKQTAKASAIQQIEHNLALNPVVQGASFRLNAVYFAPNRAELAPESRVELDRLAAWCKYNPRLRLEIQGHTDNTGGAAAQHQKLSQERAQAVRNYLIQAGISADRLKAVGYGNSQPIGDNQTAEGRQLNRRVAVKILEL
jgi:OmpA-OmpF porin, OOP family